MIYKVQPTYISSQYTISMKTVTHLQLNLLSLCGSPPIFGIYTEIVLCDLWFFLCLAFLDLERK